MTRLRHSRRKSFQRTDVPSTLSISYLKGKKKKRPVSFFLLDLDNNISSIDHLSRDRRFLNVPLGNFSLSLSLSFIVIINLREYACKSF